MYAISKKLCFNAGSFVKSLGSPLELEPEPESKTEPPEDDLFNDLLCETLTPTPMATPVMTIIPTSEPITYMKKDTYKINGTGTRLN